MPSVAEPRHEWLERRSTFVDRLKALRISSSLTQPDLCRKVGHGLSVNAYKKYEWTSGNALPDQERTSQIIGALGPEAADLEELRAAADQARVAWKKHQQFPEDAGFADPEPRYQPWKGYSFQDLFRRSVEAVIANCTQTQTDHGTVIGWRHFLENQDLPVTAMASSYGLRILLMANHAGSVPSIGQICDSILTLELEGGGWNARTQNRLARVEAYGPILHALRLSGLADEALTQRVAHYEEILEPDFDPATWNHTTILTTACNTLSAVRPESPRIPQLLDGLFRGVVESEELAWWTPSLSSSRMSQLSPSTVHTARAICSIAQAPPETTTDLVPTAVKAIRWLERQRRYNDVYDIIERSSDKDIEILNMRHFAAAWAGRALAIGCRWTEVQIDALRFAEDQILRSAHSDGLWRWESGEQPIWMTFQGLRTLRDIALAEHDLIRTL